MKRVFVTSRLPAEALELLDDQARLRLWPDPSPPSPEQLRAEVADAHGLICLLTDVVDADLLSHAAHLEVVSNVAVGLDNIDLRACAQRGIRVGHTPGVLTEATADLTWALILAASRRVAEADRFVRQGQWKGWRPDLMLGKDLAGGTLGIIGLGKIGQAVARRAPAFGMKVIAHTRSTKDLPGVEMVDLNGLLRRSDVISVHVPLDRRTRNLLGPKEIHSMKKGVVLVNTSRGPVVDEAALTEALRSGHIFAAGLDVYENEPLATDSPLLRLPNVVLLPHIGSATEMTRLNMAKVACENLVAGLQGRPMISEASLLENPRAEPQ